jgi:PAS domain S-box-containing protein
MTMINLIWGPVMVAVLFTVVLLVRNAQRDGTLHQPGFLTVIAGMVGVSVAMLLEVISALNPGLWEPWIGITRMVIFFLGGALLILRGFYQWAPLGAEVRRQYETAQAELKARREAQAQLREAHDLLEQRVLERTAALRDANRRLELQAQTFATLAEGVIVLDLKGKILDANAAAARIFGYPVQRIVGRKFKTGLFNGMFLQSWEHLRHLLEKTGQWVGDVEYRHPNGQTLVVNYRIILYCNDQDVPEGFIAVGRDITIQRRNEIVLQRHSLAFANLTESIIITDTHGMVLDCNPATLAIYGGNRGDYVGKNAVDIERSDVKVEQIVAIFDAVRRDGRWDGNLNFNRLEGENVTVAATILELYDDAGDSMGGVILSRDITRDVQQEAMRRENEALLQSVLQSTSARIAVLDGRGERILANQVWHNDFGNAPLANGSSPLLPINDLRRGAPLLPPRTAESQEAAAGIGAVLQGREATFTYEYQVETHNAIRWYLMQVAPLLMQQGGVVITHTDITERKVVHLNLLRQERLALLGRLATTVLHELNNPLQAMQMNLELVLDFQVKGAEQRELLENVRTEIERLNRGTMRILNFSHSRHPISRPINLLEVLQQTLPLVQSELDHKGISIEWHINPIPLVQIDPHELTQVFLNLLLHVRDTLKQGGILQIETDARDGWAVVTFQHNSIAMPTELLLHLFEPFFVHNGESTGLGLYTCQSILEQYGGTIRGENLPESQGVQLTMALPALLPSVTE